MTKSKKNDIIGTKHKIDNMKQDKISFIFIFCLISLIFVPNSVLALTANDPSLPDQWYFKSINAPAAWDQTVGSRKVIVAILDTGVEVAHPDLLENIWHNPEEFAFNGLDDDNNGYIDDVYGWDFIENKSNPGPNISVSTSSIGLHHGTIVAGLIGAVGNNGTDGVGVNWQVSLMPLRVLDSDGSGNASEVARAIDYAVQEHAAVINMSFIGVDPGKELQQAINRAIQAGVVLVAAGGNDGNKIIGGDLDFNHQYPVCYDGQNGERWGVIGVAALDKNDVKAPFSDYGWQCIDIAAPGVLMPSTLVYNPNQKGLDKSFGGHWSGTSLAAPLVSGAAALLKSLRPSLTSKEIYEILTKSAESLSANDLFYSDQLGAGKLNLGKAVVLLKTLFPEPVVQKLPTQQILVYQQIKNKKIKFFDINGEAREFQSKIKIINRNSLPKKAFLFYNRYKGNLAIIKGDIDGDWEKEFVTVKPGLNPVAIIWSSEGVKKGEIKIKGDYRRGIGLVVF